MQPKIFAMLNCKPLIIFEKRIQIKVENSLTYNDKFFAAFAKIKVGFCFLDRAQKGQINCFYKFGVNPAIFPSYTQNVPFYENQIFAYYFS